MKKVILRTLSHPFEGEMLKDILKTINVDCWISNQNGPEKMSNYLGEKAGETYLYVLEKDVDLAENFLSAELRDPEPLEELPPMAFPYWIIPSFGLILLLFFLIQSRGV